MWIGHDPQMRKATLPEPTEQLKVARATSGVEATDRASSNGLTEDAKFCDLFEQSGFRIFGEPPQWRSHGTTIGAELTHESLAGGEHTVRQQRAYELYRFQLQSLCRGQVAGFVCGDDQGGAIFAEKLGLCLGKS